MSRNYDVIVIFPIYGPFEAIEKPWSVELTFSSKVTFYPTKTENRTQKSLMQL